MEELDLVVKLLRKFLAGSLNEAEREQLKAWVDSSPDNRVLLDELSDDSSLLAGYTDYLKIYDDAVPERLRSIENRLMQSIGDLSSGQYTPKRRSFRWVPYAAAVLVALFTVTWYVYKNKLSSFSSVAHAETVIGPGGNRATLTLADGRKVVLDSTQNGIAVAGGHLTYLDGTDLFLADHGQISAEGSVDTLTLSTPRGGQYRIALPDGSEVWLNAMSTLKYTSRFSASERSVELIGEGYFAVKGDKSRPFRVVTGGQTVEVLGTEFNISAYQDEPAVKTTLVSGSVRLNVEGASVELKPGEQGVSMNGALSKNKVNTEPYTSWKDGRFVFDHTSFEDMISQMARWYDVAVIYEGVVPQETFTGKMGRNLTLNEMLKLLDIYDAEFRLEGHKLFVE